MADNKVTFEVVATAKGVNQVQKQTDKLAKSTDGADKSTQRLDKSRNTYNRREKGAAGISSNSTKNFSKMAQSVDGGGGSGGLVRAYALLAANVFALSAAFGILSRSAQIDTLTESMRQLEIVSGKSIVGVARNLQEASGFGLDFAESMRAVSLATSAGFGGKDIEKLGEVARNAAVSLGRNLPDALDRIFRGVIKIEPELLDEIGLFIRVNEAAGKYASKLKVSVGDLTEFQKRQAFLNEALEQGTSKFEAFASIENDPFALLATTFSDITQNVVSFVNTGIGPMVKLLAENKLLFSTVFAAIGGALLKLAIPAMAAFTASIAANAVKTAAAASAAKQSAVAKSLLTKKNHLAEMKNAEVELRMKAELLAADTKKGPQGAGVMSKGKNQKNAEAALKKDLNLNTRMIQVKQRIAVLTKADGTARVNLSKQSQKELQNLQAEAAIHKQINASLKQQAVTRGTQAKAGIGSDVAVAKLHAYNIALKATSIANIANEVQTVGLKAAFKMLGAELTVLTTKGAFGTGVMGALAKSLFALKGAAVSLGVAFQGLWMKIMGPLSALLMFLPLLQGVAKWTGIGTKAAEESTKANKAAADALGLLTPRLAHVRKELKGLATGDATSWNDGMLTFKNTILSTATAIKEQEDAFEAYRASANGWAQFWGESLPAAFGGGTANAIRKGKEQMIAELNAMGDEVTPAMAKLLAAADPKNFNATGEKSGGGLQENLRNPQKKADPEGQKTADNAVIVQAVAEAKAFINVESAISGAKDAARAFQDSLVTSTIVDKPLASFNQITKALESSFLTEKEIKKQIKEISGDSAILSLMTQSQRDILQDENATQAVKLALLDKVRDNYFDQQQSLIRIKAETKQLSILNKNISSSTKMSSAAIGKQFKIEKSIRENKAEELAFARENAVIGSSLTEERIRQLATEKDIKGALDVEESQTTDIKQLQVAINAIRKEENELLQQKFDIATASARQSIMEAKASMQVLDIAKKGLSLAAEKARLDAKTASANITGSGALSRTAELALELKLNKEKAANDASILVQQQNLVKAQMLVEQKKMMVLAMQNSGNADFQVYFDAANAFKQAGIDMAKNIEDAAANAATTFKEKIRSGFDETFSGSEMGDSSLSSDIGFGLDTLTAKDKDGEAMFGKVEQQKMAIKMVETSLLSLAETVKKTLGEDGAVLAAMATMGAGLMSISTNVSEVFEDTKDKSKRLAAVFAGVAAALGGIMSIVSAKSAEATKAIDQLIAAEGKRDGKSSESVAKMKSLEKQKESMQRKAFETNKKLMMAQAIASTAAGIAAALPIYALMPPVGAAIIAMIAGVGAAQLAIMSGLTFQGGGSVDSPSMPSTIDVGKRNNSIDTAKAATGGETSFLRGQKGTGSNGNNFIGGASGLSRSYASGGEILVGERGPEVIQPTNSGYNVIPNDKLSGGTSNVNFTINAVDAAGVADVLSAQRGNIIGMIREAANEHGEEFMESVDTGVYS